MKSPQDDVDRHPGDHRQHPCRAAAHQVELAQRNGADRAQLHGDAPGASRCRAAPRPRAARASGSRASRMNSSSSEAAPCCARQAPGIAFQQYPAARQEQHPVAGVLDFVHVVRGPENAAAGARRHGANARADQVGGRRIERGGGLIEQQQPRVVHHAPWPAPAASARPRTVPRCGYCAGAAGRIRPAASRSGWRRPARRISG